MKNTQKYDLKEAEGEKYANSTENNVVNQDM